MENKHKIVGQWLFVGVLMLMVQVLLGGITRLTGSGLSMTDWKPILGAIPPLNDVDWNNAFDQYKKIGQFSYINADFTLGDFKFIFFWEWFHRLWARLISVVFLIPFVYLLYKGLFKLSDIPKFLLLFAIGILLAVVGKIMVFSGLNPEDVHVNHIKLAMHFNIAMFLISLTFWFALQKIYPNTTALKTNKRHKTILITIIILLAVQLIYGAFMAGIKAAQAAPTWPTINGDWVPDSIFVKSIIDHSISIHFVHRGLAYFLFFFVCYWSYLAVQKIKLRKAMLPAILVILQVILGISTVLTSPFAVKNGWGIFEWNAQLHQLIAMMLLLSLIYHLFQFRQCEKMT